MAPAGRPVIVLDVREDPFTVTGSTIAELRRVLAVLAPLRDGMRWAAYTDWEVTYRVMPAAHDARAALAPVKTHDGLAALAPPASRDARAAIAPEVRVSAVVRLPRWWAPPSAPRDLVLRWERYVAALRRHEDGHVAIAKAAGEAVLARLTALPPAAGESEIRRAAAAAVAELRAIERAYDEDTRHGAAQGAVLFQREVA